MLPLLQIQDLSVAFHHQSPVVRQLNLTIHAGEKVALVGESGSGKSVTAHSILRLYETQQGQHVTYPTGSIQFQQQNLLALSPLAMRAIRGKAIAMIFQEPMTALNPVLTVGEQISEVLRLHEGMSRKQAQHRALELLELTGIPEPHRRIYAYPHTLSGGQRQRVMIAMALACRPQLLIADEPTTALDVTIQAQILQLLEEMQQQFNMAILLITHDLPLVKRFAERVYVMERGELVEHAPAAQLFAAPQHAYTRKLLDSQLNQSFITPLTAENPAVLTAQQLSCHFKNQSHFFFSRNTSILKAVDNVDLKLSQGETLGIVGESGSGKTTLGKCLLALQTFQGQLFFEQQAIHSLKKAQLQTLRKQFQVVFQDPYASLSPRLTIERIVGEGLEIHERHLSRLQRREKIVQMLEEVGLKSEALNRYPHQFSGGQRQRIAIARAIILQPKVVLLDEPTSALDVSIQKQVLELLKQLQQRYQMSYIFITHDLRVIRAMAHRVIVMKSGQFVEQGTTSTIFHTPQAEYTRQLLAAALF